MPTDLAPRFEALLKSLDTKKTQLSCAPTVRERAMMAVFWEQITPTFQEYGKLRVRLEAAERKLKALGHHDPE